MWSNSKLYNIYLMSLYDNYIHLATVVWPLLDLAIYNSNHLRPSGFLKCRGLVKIKSLNMHVNFDPSHYIF